MNKRTHGFFTPSSTCNLVKLKCLIWFFPEIASPRSDYAREGGRQVSPLRPLAAPLPDVGSMAAGGQKAPAELADQLALKVGFPASWMLLQLPMFGVGSFQNYFLFLATAGVGAVTLTRLQLNNSKI